MSYELLQCVYIFGGNTLYILFCFLSSENREAKMCLLLAHPNDVKNSPFLCVCGGGGSNQKWHLILILEGSFVFLFVIFLFITKDLLEGSFSFFFPFSPVGFSPPPHCVHSLPSQRTLNFFLLIITLF